MTSIFVIFFTGCQLKDVKDHAGDAANGVITLSTIIGARPAYISATISVCLAFLVCATTLDMQMTSVAVCAGLIFLISAWLKESEKLLIVLQFFTHPHSLGLLRTRACARERMGVEVLPCSRSKNNSY